MSAHFRSRIDGRPRTRVTAAIRQVSLATQNRFPRLTSFHARKNAHQTSGGPVLSVKLRVAPFFHVLSLGGPVLRVFLNRVLDHRLVPRDVKDLLVMRFHALGSYSES